MIQVAPISFAEAERLSLVFDADDREQWQKTSLILEALDLQPGMVIADVGAGTGYFSSLFSDRLPEGQVHALDTEPNMLSHMANRFAQEGRCNIILSQSRHDDPCLPPGLDLVFLANVYRFIQARETFLANLYQQIEDSTRVVFVDFKGEQARVSPQQAVNEVTAAGFVVERMDIHACPDHYILQFRKSTELRQGTNLGF